MLTLRGLAVHLPAHHQHGSFPRLSGVILHPNGDRMAAVACAQFQQNGLGESIDRLPNAKTDELAG